MAGGWKLEDNSDAVISKMKDAVEAVLDEIGKELVSQVHRQYDAHGVDGGQTAGSFEYKVVFEGDEAFVAVGSDKPNAIWEEYGTGEFAEGEGGGRQGYWVFVDDGSEGTLQRKGGKAYTLEEAKKIMAILRKKGLPAYYTRGKHARHQFQTAYVKNKEKFKKVAQERIGAELNEL